MMLISWSLNLVCQIFLSIVSHTNCPVSWRLTVEVLVEQYALHCFGLAGASEWCRMERRTVHSCSSRFLRESGCIQASVLSPASVDGVCGGSLSRVVIAWSCYGWREVIASHKSGDDLYLCVYSLLQKLVREVDDWCFVYVHFLVFCL